MRIGPHNTKTTSTMKQNTITDSPSFIEVDPINHSTTCNKDDMDANDDDADHDNADVDDTYDLEQIISHDCLLTGAPLCSGGDTVQCKLLACSVWIATKEPTKKWYYCVDCQKRDFCGWPPAAEMPCRNLEPEHLRIIAKNCSLDPNPQMPTTTTTTTTMNSNPSEEALDKEEEGHLRTSVCTLYGTGTAFITRTIFGFNSADSNYHSVS